MWKRETESGRLSICLLHLQCKNKVSLQNLSMVLRQLRTDSGDEHSRHVMDSVRQAKLAVQMDIHDGRSWCECSQKISNRCLEQGFSAMAAYQGPSVEAASKCEAREFVLKKSTRYSDEPLF